MCWTLGKLFFDLNFGLRRDCAWLTGGGIDCHQDNWGWCRHLLAHPGNLFVFLARFFYWPLLTLESDETHILLPFDQLHLNKRESTEKEQMSTPLPATALKTPPTWIRWLKTFDGSLKKPTRPTKTRTTACHAPKPGIESNVSRFFSLSGCNYVSFSSTCSRERGRRQSWTRSKQRRVFSPQQTRRGPPPARRRQAWISSWKFRVVWKDLKAKDHAYDGPKATEHQRVLLQFDLLPKKSWFKFWGVFSSISDNLETHLVGLDTMHDVEDITSPSSKE